MDVLEKLRRKTHFTSAEVKITDYILAHMEDISKLSVSEVAQGAEYSSTSVIRLCHKMGFSGYREFQISLLACLVSRRTEREETPNRTNYHGFIGENILNSFPDVIMKAVDNCQRSIPKQALYRAASLIAAAHRVGIYKSRFLNIPALCCTLNSIGISSFVADCLLESVCLDYTCMDDSIFVLAQAGTAFYTMQDRLEELRSHGVKVIAITSEDIYPEADHLIRFPRREFNSVDEETLYIQAALLYISSCLLRLVRLFCLEDKAHKNE